MGIGIGSQQELNLSSHLLTKRARTMRNINSPTLPSSRVPWAVARVTAGTLNKFRNWQVDMMATAASPGKRMDEPD